MSQKFLSEINLQALNNATTDTDKFLVSDSGVVKYRTGAEVLSDIGAAPASGSGNYIQNQIASAQSANMWISGNAYINNNVGIGTSTPISGSGLTIGNDASGGATVKLAFSTSAAERGSLSMTGSSGEMRLTSGYSGYGGFTTFYNNGSESMRIFSNGSVGIGTTSASAKFVTLDTANNIAALIGGGASSPSWMGIGTVNSGATPFIQGYNNALSLTNNISINPSGGNVGIGTSSPSQKLTVNGSIAATTGGNIILYTPSNDDFTNIYYDSSYALNLSSSSGIVKLYGYNGVSINTYTTPNAVTVLQNGNVGIGTTSPTVKLQVDNNTHNYFNLNSTVANVQTAISAQNTLSGKRATLSWEDGTRGDFADLYSSTLLTFTTQSSEKMRITSTGNVGIGTTSPNNRLSISGGSIEIQSGAGKIGFNVNDSFTAYGGSIAHYGMSRANGSDPVAISGYYGVGVFTDGSERMRINGIGNVGIGTTSPATKFQVSESGSVFYVGNAYAKVENTAGSSSTFYLADTTDSAAIKNIGSSLAFLNSSTEGMRLTTTGLGIGTTNPTNAKLKVSGGGASGAIMSEDTSGSTSFVRVLGDISSQNLINWQSDTALRFATSNQDYSSFSERMRITSGGNVGIGTTNPLAMLHVASGEIRNSFGSGQGGTNYFNIIDGVSNGFKTVVTTSNQIDYTFHNGANQAILNLAESGAATFSSSVTTSSYMSAVGLYTNRITPQSGTQLNLYDTLYAISSGNVGIGTTSPLGKLTIKDVDTSFEINTDSNETSLLSFNRTTSNYKSMQFRGSAFVFAPNDVEKVRITSSGNVGIGTSSPGSLLQVGPGTSNSPSTVASLGGTVSGILSALSLVNTNGIDSPGYGTALDFHLNSGYSPTGRIATLAEPSNPSASLVFYTYGGGLGEKMRITSTGYVGIGTTSPASKLQVDGAGYSLVAGYDSGNRRVYIGLDSAGEPSIQGALSNGTARQLSLNPSGGNVGIGTTSGLARTTILSDSSAQAIGLIGRSADNISTIRWWNNAGNSIYTAIESNANYTIYNTVTNGYAGFYTNNTERMRITSAGNVGIGTTTPSAILDVAGDALINQLTIGRGGGNISSNTALGRGTLDSNTTGENNIAVGANANTSNNISGSTVIGVDLFTNPSGVSGLTSNSVAISQYNPDFSGTQYPHIYAPDKILCPNGNVTTDVFAIDYSIYTAAFIEYSIFNSAGDEFRAGTYTVAFKGGTGTPVEDDNQTVVYSGTTLSATFLISLSGSIATIQLRNQDSDNYYIRFTSRLLMR
jgi:hypothetical protein